MKSTVRMVTSLMLVCAAFAAVGYMASGTQASGDKSFTSLTASAGVPVRAKRVRVEEPVSYLDRIINEENQLPADYTPEQLVLVSYTDVRMEEGAAKQLELLMADMEQQGMTIQPVTGYLSYGRQKTLYDRKVTELLRRDEQLSFEEALEEAAKYVEKPGTSEHQTGYAIDIAVDDLAGTVIEETPEGHWLLENAHLYGFIQRYPQDKSEITGVSDEPWHFRYVGRDTALKLYEEGLCLEELR